MSNSLMQTDIFLKEVKIKLDIEKPYVEAIRKHPFILNLRKIGLSPEDWKSYGIERYLSAQKFIPLLEAAYSHAKTTLEDNELAKVLAINLADERGETCPEAGTHEKWRQDFYSAIGISNTELANAVSPETVRNYSSTLQNATNNPFHSIGAILFLEVTIPYEFHALLESCEVTFPYKFKLKNDDLAEIRNEKENARRYLEDHIHHDMKEHFFDLKRVLSHHLSIPKCKQDIVEGMELVKNVKIAHMNSLNDKFFIT